MTRFGGPKQACPRTSHSRPSPRSPPAFAGAGLQQMRQARADGVPPAVALADPAYGNNSSFRAEITELGLPYAVGIMPTTTVWRPAGRRRPDRAVAGAPPGCAATRRISRSRSRRWPWSFPPMHGSKSPRPSPGQAWREGSNAVLTSRFARLRVRVAHGDAKRSEPAAEEWLLIEWPDGEAEPDHYWLSTLPADISFECLVDLTKLPPAFAGAGLAHRARLSRTEAGGWARSLRGPRMARLPPSRQSLASLPTDS
jgi:SRSO17 transposase